MGADWRAALRQAGKAATASTYEGEILDFEAPAAVFGSLTERRWAIVQALQHNGGTVAVRELARRLGRDLKRVHEEDAAELVTLGLVERTEAGALLCTWLRQPEHSATGGFRPQAVGRGWHLKQLSAE